MKRGRYQALYQVIWTDPDFRRLSTDAKLLLLILLTGDQSNQARMFPAKWGAVSDLTGSPPWPEERLKDAIRMLSEGHWIAFDEALIWVRNGLRFDPLFQWGTPNHVKGLENCLRALPKSPLIKNFCDYYELECPFDDIPEAYPNPFECHSDSILNTIPTPTPIPTPNPPIVPPGGDEGVASEPEKKKPGPEDYTAEFEKFWQDYPRKVGKPAAFKCWVRVVRGLPNTITVEDLSAVSKNYAVAMKAEGRVVDKMKHAATLLGPDRWYIDYLPGAKVDPAPVDDDGEILDDGERA